MHRSRLRAEDGFTLVEILVVILIIGVLAAIAMPAFLNQRGKAHDAEAKVAVTTAARAMVVRESDTGTFAGTTRAELATIEPSLDHALGLDIEATARAFTVSVISRAGGSFVIERDADGTTHRSCTEPGQGACSDAADANGNSW